MILHFQKKHLNINITGDYDVERKFEPQQIFQIKQSEQKNFKIKVDESQDPSKRSRSIVMTKKLRKIEQETRITREEFDVLFENQSNKVQPLDQFEVEYQRKHQKQGNEEVKLSKQDEKFDEFIFREQEKVNRLNQEYLTLKNRLFQPRRGRNNRIFYKGMEKTVFDYDSNEEDLIGFEKPKASKKRSYGQHSNNFSLNIDKLLLGQR